MVVNGCVKFQEKSFSQILRKRVATKNLHTAACPPPDCRPLPAARPPP
jgi:hypothetical protein